MRCISPLSYWADDDGYWERMAVALQIGIESGNFVRNKQLNTDKSRHNLRLKPFLSVEPLKSCPGDRSKNNLKEKIPMNF